MTQSTTNRNDSPKAERLDFDETFAKVLEDNGYIPDAEYITLDDVKDIRELDLSFEGITSLKGIEYFLSLETLDCGCNNLQTLDVSKNIKLIELNCSMNKLSSLDLSNNTELKYLNCGNNELQTLDISKDIELIGLHCRKDERPPLDMNCNTKFIYLYGAGNELQILDPGKIELTDRFSDEDATIVVGFEMQQKTGSARLRRK